MAYQSATEQLRKALEGYSEREDRLTRLYSEATKRLDESRRKGLESLERDHGEARRTAAADAAREERNTMNLMASRGLGFSGEAAQARLNESALLNTRLGELSGRLSDSKDKLESEHGERSFELQKNYINSMDDIGEKRNSLLKSIAELEIKRAESEAKANAAYIAAASKGSGGKAGTSGGGSSESGKDEEGSYTPSVSPSALAKQIVSSVTDGKERIDGAEAHYRVSKYLLELQNKYRLSDKYIKELGFLLNGYGYGETSTADKRREVIIHDAPAYYQSELERIYDRLMSEGGYDEYSAGISAKEAAMKSQLAHIYSQCVSEAEFRECCEALSISGDAVNGFLKTVRSSNPGGGKKETDRSSGPRRPDYTDTRLL